MKSYQERFDDLKEDIRKYRWTDSSDIEEFKRRLHYTITDVIRDVQKLRSVLGDDSIADSLEKNTDQILMLFSLLSNAIDGMGE